MAELPVELGPVEPSHKRARTSKRSLERVPDSMQEFATFDWHRPGACFVAVVDCQPVQMVACGHSPLQAGELTKVFSDIILNIGVLLDEEWNAPQ
eukprot:4730098-Karenia_brevis.AAC.1